MSLPRFASLSFLPLLFAPLAAQAQAPSATDPRAYTFANPDVTVTYENTTALDAHSTAEFLALAPPLPSATVTGDPLASLDAGVSLTKEIINLGKSLWAIVEQNRPKVNLDAALTGEQFASALPVGVTAASELQGWKGPGAATVKLSWKNLYGMEIAALHYKLTFFHGGSLNQHGQYIHEAAVLADRVSVAWGFQLDAGVAVAEPVNLGTKEDPIAGLQVVVRYGLKSPFKEERGRKIHFLRGDGAATTL